MKIWNHKDGGPLNITIIASLVVSIAAYISAIYHSSAYTRVGYIDVIYICLIGGIFLLLLARKIRVTRNFLIGLSLFLHWLSAICFGWALLGVAGLWFYAVTLIREKGEAGTLMVCDYFNNGNFLNSDCFNIFGVLLMCGFLILTIILSIWSISRLRAEFEVPGTQH